MFWHDNSLCKFVDVFAIFENAVYECANWLTTSLYKDTCGWINTTVSRFSDCLPDATLSLCLNVINYTRTVMFVLNEKETRIEPSCWLWSNLVHGSIVLGLFCLCLYVLIWCADVFALRYWQRYAQLPSRNRQLYVLLNLSKAFCLALLFFSYTWFSELYALFVMDKWSTVGWRRLVRIKHTAALYVATDVVALFVVPSLPQTTVLHHYAAWFLALCIFGTDVSLPESQVVRMIMLYGAWSTVPYAVNAFLALRRLSDDPDDGEAKPKVGTFKKKEETRAVQYSGRKRLNALAAFSLVVYFTTCTVNWAWHAYWLVGEMKQAFFRFVNVHDASFTHYFMHSSIDTWLPSLFIAFYVLFVMVLARDDLILMKWLWKRTQEVPIVNVTIRSFSPIRTLVSKSLQFFTYRSLPERTTEAMQ